MISPPTSGGAPGTRSAFPRTTAAATSPTGRPSRLRTTTTRVGCPSSGSEVFGFRKLEPWTKDFGLWSSGSLPSPVFQGTWASALQPNSPPPAKPDVASPTKRECDDSIALSFFVSKKLLYFILRLGFCTVVGTKPYLSTSFRLHVCRIGCNRLFGIRRTLDRSTPHSCISDFAQFVSRSPRKQVER